jgi:hypothetical protein
MVRDVALGAGCLSSPWHSKDRAAQHGYSPLDVGLQLLLLLRRFIEKADIIEEHVKHEFHVDEGACGMVRRYLLSMFVPHTAVPPR